MADQANDLLAIEVDAEDYAETAAGDAPAVSRTHQSEADFQAQKTAYSAKIDGGNTYRDLIAAVPILDSKTSHPHANGKDMQAKVKLSKKGGQLLGYAVGELYYAKRYGEIIDLCDRVSRCCGVDEKTSESLDRWMKRCREDSLGGGI